LKKIAIYGKGGSGKSTISAALSITFAKAGLKVLHVGCDPKSDSTLTLTDGNRPVTLLELLSQGRNDPAEEEFIFKGRYGIDCVEAGGPEPGAGCGGRGIARMFEFFEEINLLERRQPDVVMFDVLGDVVCGGFAAPLRHGFADRAFIVLSEEPLSVYAANNILRALVTYSANGVHFGGLIHNVSDDLSARRRIERFAKAVDGKIAGMMPRDSAIQEVELDYLTAADLPPDSPTVDAVNKLAKAVLASFDETPPLPQPLDVDDLFELVSSRKRKGKRSQSPIQRAKGRQTRLVPGKLADQMDDSAPAVRTLPPDVPVIAGPQGRTLAARALGLDASKAAQMQLQVSEFLHDRDSLQIKIQSPVTPDLGVQLKLATPEEKSYAAVGDIAVSYFTSLSKKSQQVLDYVVRSLKSSGPSYAQLQQVLIEDPESEVLASLEEARDEVKRSAGPSTRHWSIWGKKGTLGKFFYVQERARQVFGEVRILDGSVNIHHGTDACQTSEQPTTPYSIHFVRNPWIVRDMEHEERDESLWLFTNINDYELIAGSNEALQTALEMAGKAGEGRPVCVDVSCIPVIAGEDWEGVVRKFADSYPGEVTASAVSATNVSAQIVEAGNIVAGGIDASAFQPPARSVHLVGFPPTKVTLELVELLQELDITVAQRQLPGVSLRGLARYPEARVQLLWPQSEYEPLYADLFRKLPVEAVECIPPFGVDATVGFLKQVCQALEIPEQEVEEKLGVYISDARDKMAPFLSRVQGRRLGVALLTSQADLLSNPANLCGIPLSSLVEKLGYTLEVLNDSENEGRLAWWLKSGLAAVYSDLSRDQRLLNLGIGHFSLADFEPGFAGALRTARRLASISDAPFFRKLAHWTGKGS
jgi:nitrogenase iron protein NifH